MPDDFGGRLRRRREEQGVSLAAIAEQTKIKASLLEALERNDVSQWPHGIFRRAYLRSYAAAIGLDADAVVHEFLALHPDRADLFVEEPTVGPVEEGRTSAPPTRFRYLMDSAIGSLGRRRRGPTTDRIATPSAVERPVLPGLDSVPAPAIDVPVPAAPAEPVVVLAPPVDQSPLADPLLSELARLATTFGQVGKVEDIQPLLLEAVRLLQASGLIVWVWDESADELRPVLAAGYSAKTLGQLPTLRRDADNLTADAFRSACTCSIPGDPHSNAALVVPMVGPVGCTGVLALELPGPGEPRPSVQSAATILATLVTLLIGGSALDAEVRAEGPAVAGQTGPHVRAMHR